MKLFRYLSAKKLFLIIFAFGVLLISAPARAQEKINIYFFYGDGCPHCAKEEKFLSRLENEKDSIKIFRFETWHDSDNRELLKKIAKALNLDIRGVPFTVIGDQTVSGYFNDQVTGKKILDIISEYEQLGCSDVVAPIIGNSQNINQCMHGCDADDEECMHNCGCDADATSTKMNIPDAISIPFFGEVKIQNVSLPILTFLIAATDGFNPCAMWVLLFLINLLLGMHDRVRMWTLGSAFIIASGLVYFLFLSAWLNLFLFIGFISIIRITIGLVALASGAWHLKDAWKKRDGGCGVVSTEKRKKVFAKLRGLAGERNFLIAFSGIVLLAFAVNLVELVCSAGLPAVYTQVLALADLPRWQYYGYLLFYILIFMLDDLLIFFIAMTTLKMQAISSRYTKWSGWVGGIIMLLVGLLLLFKPGWLMFG